jgi:hypothetical protein
MTIFERASRQRLRFDSSKGQLTVEDLWDLPLSSEKGASLDKVAQLIYTNLNGVQSISFVGESTEANTLDRLRMDIVLHVIDTKKAENAAARKATDNRIEAQRILEQMAKLQDKALDNMTMDQLQARLNELQGK